jgi:thymidine phosphorylase
VLDDPGRLATAALQGTVVALEAGVVSEVRPKELGQGVVALGGGRQRMDQAIDLGVGFEVQVRPGETVSKGDLLAVVHATDTRGLEIGEQVVRAAVRVGDDSMQSQRPLVSHVVDVSGVSAAT